MISVGGSIDVCSGSTAGLLKTLLVCLEELMEWSFMSTFKTSTIWIKNTRCKASTNGLASRRKISYSPRRMTSSGDRHQDKGQVKMCLREAFP